MWNIKSEESVGERSLACKPREHPLGFSLRRYTGGGIQYRIENIYIYAIIFSEMIFHP